ncbi:MAG: hypothetical protein U0930_18905 [Pirellulales bacterium]
MADLKRIYNIRKSLLDKRLNSAEHQRTIAKANERISAGDTKIEIRIPAETSQEFEARLQMFAVLTTKQLDDFLRLNRSIRADQHATNWISSFTEEKRTVAEAIFKAGK